MSHFRKDATTTEHLLEVISNQLQLSNLYHVGNKYAEAQIETLRIKIINQRADLNIAVDGV